MRFRTLGLWIAVFFLFGAMIQTARSFSTRSSLRIRPLRSTLADGVGGGALSHVDCPNSHITPYWIEQLRLLERSEKVKPLISQLVPDNALGFDPNKGGGYSVASTPTKSPARQGTFLDFAIQKKKLHKDNVILIRSGEFYETYGVDAIMLVAYAGLNAMGNKAKAGCPAKNVQATLDSLTSVGLSVAVYEEITEVDIARVASKSRDQENGVGGTEGAKSKIKSRALTQIVSPASSTYVYDLCLRSDDIAFKENRPAIGLMHSTQGYTLCHVYLDEQRMEIYERLTEEAVRSMLATSGAIEPIYVQSLPRAGSEMHFLRDHAVEKLSGYSAQDFPNQVLQRLHNHFRIDTAKFRLHHIAPHTSASTAPRPLYTSTALQIGLLPNENVPDLVPHLLPRTSSTSSARFLQHWLLHPPPPVMADHMQRLLRILAQAPHVSVPPFQPVSVGKVVSLLSAKQCNVALFREIAMNMRSVLDMLVRAELHDAHVQSADGAYVSADSLLVQLAADPSALGTIAAPAIPQLSERDLLRFILASLLPITGHVSGLVTPVSQLFERCSQVLSALEAVIAPYGAEEHDPISVDPNTNSNTARVPDEFFRRNEEPFRGKILPQHDDIRVVYAEIDTAAQELCQVVKEVVPSNMDVVHDMFENSLMLRKKPNGGRKKKTADDASSSISSSTSDNAVVADEFITYRDRKGKTVEQRLTTPRLQEALQRYLTLTEAAPYAVSAILQRLSQQLVQDLVSIVQVSHLAVVLQTASAHAASANQKGWSFAQLLDADDADSSSASPHVLHAKDVTPYWFSRERAVGNSVSLQGITLLTAPNMSGKSTLMRSLLVLALLANSGLCVPAAVGSAVPRIDCFFLRTASYDVPSEEKSAFALEMDDVRVILRDVTSRSLVMVDELGKGTSARDGSALAGALLEELVDRRCAGIFATHLHELFHLPLRCLRADVSAEQRVVERRMGYRWSSSDGDVASLPKWTYRLEEGRCEDSMALVTAQQYHIPTTVIRRAEELLREFDQRCRPSSTMPNNANESASHVDVKSVPGSQTASRSAGAFPVHANAMKYGHQKYLDTEVRPILAEWLAQRAGDATDEPVTNVSPLVSIPPGHQPSAALEGRSCVYVLHIFLPHQDTQGVFYVGETESLRQRLHQHRLFYNKKGMVVAALAVNVPDKSTARMLESRWIQLLKDMKGLVFERDSDANHSLFSSTARGL